MKIKLFLPLLFVFVTFQNFSCQQKKDSGQTIQIINDSTPISPTSMGPEAVEKTTDKIERKDTVPSKTRIIIKDLQAQVLAEGTQIGKPGDMLLTFSGQGFVFTERNPVLLAGGLKFDNTYSNEDASEFYVVIPADSKERLKAAARGGLQIINPDKESATFKEGGGEIIKKADDIKKVMLVYTKFAVTRKLVDK
jgi:hypothetical protein